MSVSWSGVVGPASIRDAKTAVTAGFAPEKTMD